MTRNSTSDSWRSIASVSSTRHQQFLPSQQSNSSVSGWLTIDQHATIITTQLNAASGSVVTFMSKPNIDQPEEPEIFDELDAEIARMSDTEIIDIIKASAGMWANRDDLDDLMDRSDRIDELYGNPSNNSDPSL